MTPDTKHTPKPTLDRLQIALLKSILKGWEEEDVSFIVRAVRAHDALLEAVKHLHGEYIDTHEVGHPPKIGCHECEVIVLAEGKSNE